ncbi:MAG: hypothetical protein ACK4F9_03630 [Brevinematia bacterium]
MSKFKSHNRGNIMEIGRIICEEECKKEKLKDKLRTYLEELNSMYCTIDFMFE